jgi:hypothetical protein
VALSVLAAVYLTTTLGETTRVLAVKADIARGTAITETDLVVAELPIGPTALQSIPVDDLDQIVNKVAATDLKTGQLLAPAHLEDELRPAAGRSIVGVALAPNQMPGTDQLRAGDAVRVVETPATGGEPPSTAPFTISATVVGTKPSMIGDQTIVDVEVASGDAAGLAARAATGRVAIVIDPVGAG